MIEILMPTAQPRLRAALDFGLEGKSYRFLSPEDDLRGKRIVFALAADDCGMDAPTLSLLRRLRADPNAMEGSTAAMVVDGTGELYTKQIAQDMTLAANLSGCAFLGKPVVEATGTLYNQHILAKQRGLSWRETYFRRVRELIERLEDFVAPHFFRPKILMLHASESKSSSTLWIGRELCRRLEPYCDVSEIALQNGTIHDCRGCTYHTCLHFARSGTCFYGGAISETVLPGIRECDAMLFLCPNYNDAVGANITALFNRLTSLLLHSYLYEKYLFGVVVSGYSGSDIVARQLLGTMCLNKTAMLPPRFCMLQTANDLPSAQKIPNLSAQIDAFAAQICHTLCEENKKNEKNEK